MEGEKEGGGMRLLGSSKVPILGTQGQVLCVTVLCVPRGLTMVRVGREEVETGWVASEEQISRAVCSRLRTLDFTLKTTGIWSQSPVTTGPPSKKVLK